MGSTINGVYTGKRGRRQRALKRLEAQLSREKAFLDSVKNDKGKLPTNQFGQVIDIKQIISQFSTAHDRISREINILKSKI